MSEGPTETVRVRGDAYGNDPRHHFIRDGAFLCAAPADAPCRTSPTCECESWCCCDGSLQDAVDNHGEGEHCCMTDVRAGQGCWMEPWVDAVGIEDTFMESCSSQRPTYDEDEDAVWPDGHVACDWADGVFWTYVPDPNQPALLTLPPEEPQP